MRPALTALGAGLLFGIGLWISGMTDPRNVIGFLDFAGHWNPSLAAVMVGAIGVHATALRLGRRRRAPSRSVGTPSRPTLDGSARIDPRLVLGSAVFGIGWGLAGYCPGPAIVSLGSGSASAWRFVVAMIVGVWLAEGTHAAGLTRVTAGDAPSC
jgi:uncharacterized membrane protein YedE/YeeE